MTAPGADSYHPVTGSELAQQLFHPVNMISGADFRNGRYLTCSALFRGRVDMTDAEHQMLQVQARNSPHFVQQVPKSVQMAFCPVPPHGLETSSTLVGNSTAIQETLGPISAQFSALFRRRAWVHWYEEFGLDETEFVEAESSLNDLISEYQQHQQAAVDN